MFPEKIFIFQEDKNIFKNRKKSHNITELKFVGFLVKKSLKLRINEQNHKYIYFLNVFFGFSSITSCFIGSESQPISCQILSVATPPLLSTQRPLAVLVLSHTLQSVWRKKKT